MPQDTTGHNRTHIEQKLAEIFVARFENIDKLLIKKWEPLEGSPKLGQLLSGELLPPPFFFLFAELCPLHSWRYQGINVDPSCRLAERI